MSNNNIDTTTTTISLVTAFAAADEEDRKVLARYKAGQASLAEQLAADAAAVEIAAKAIETAVPGWGTVSDRLHLGAWYGPHGLDHVELFVEVWSPGSRRPCHATKGRLTAAEMAARQIDPAGLLALCGRRFSARELTMALAA